VRRSGHFFKVLIHFAVGKPPQNPPVPISLKKRGSMQKVMIPIMLCLALSIPSRALCVTDKDTVSWTGNVNLFLGEKFLDKDDWEPMDKQIEVGILADVKHRSVPFSIAFDFLYSKDREDIDSVDSGIGPFSTDVESCIMEFDVGIRKIWECPKNIRPFIGFGLANIVGEIKAESLGATVSDEDIGYGLWADIGAYVTLAERFNIGFELRWSNVQINLYGSEARVGGMHAGIIAGIHW
jgi:hypothetical protein